MRHDGGVHLFDHGKHVFDFDMRLADCDKCLTHFIADGVDTHGQLINSRCDWCHNGANTIAENSC